MLHVAACKQQHKPFTRTAVFLYAIAIPPPTVWAFVHTAAGCTKETAVWLGQGRRDRGSLDVKAWPPTLCHGNLEATLNGTVRHPALETQLHCTQAVPSMSGEKCLVHPHLPLQQSAKATKHWGAWVWSPGKQQQHSNLEDRKLTKPSRRGKVHWPTYVHHGGLDQQERRHTGLSAARCSFTMDYFLLLTVLQQGPC